MTKEKPIVEIESEDVVHTVKIDRYIEMRIRIPMVLDAIEFTSILEKARKMLKLSEIEVSTVNNLGKKKYITDMDDKVRLLDEYSKVSSREEKVELMKKYGYSSVLSLVKSVSAFRIKLKGAGFHSGKKGMKYFNKKEKQKELVRTYGLCDTKEKKEVLAKKLGTTLSRLQAKISYYKTTNNIVTESTLTHGKSVTTWKNGTLEKLTNLYNKGLSSSEIADELNLRRKQVYDKVFYMVKAGQLKERKETVQPDRNHLKTTPINKYSDELVNKIISMIKIKKDVNVISEMVVKEYGIKDMTPKKIYDLIFNRTGKRVSEIRGE